MKKYLSNLEQSTRGAWQEAALVSFSKSPIRSQLSWSRILNPRGLHRLGMHPQLLFQQPHRGFHTSLWFLGRRFSQKSSSHFWGCFFPGMSSGQSWVFMETRTKNSRKTPKKLPKNSWSSSFLEEPAFGRHKDNFKGSRSSPPPTKPARNSPPATSQDQTISSHHNICL